MSDFDNSPVRIGTACNALGMEVPSPARILDFSGGIAALQEKGHGCISEQGLGETEQCCKRSKRTRRYDFDSINSMMSREFFNSHTTDFHRRAGPTGNLA